MHFTDIGLTAPRPLNLADRTVEDMSRVVCALLILGLRRKLKFDGFGKISIRINHSDDHEDGAVLLGVLIVNRLFPVTEFLKWDLSSRQSHMLDFVSNVLRDICVAYGRNSTVVDEACSFVLEHEFRRTIVGKKSFLDPSRASSAHIECDQEMDEARIYIAATLSDGVTRRIEVTRSRPDEFILQNYFGTLDWAGPETIVLHGRDSTAMPVNLKLG